MRSRLSLLPILLAFAVILGGAAACSSDPNVESAKLALAQENFDEALEQLNVALETNPANAEAHALKVQVLATQLENAPLMRKGDLAPDVRSAAEAANSVAPEDPEVMRMTQYAWATLMNSGNNTIRNEDTPASQAVALFGAAAAIAPDSAASHFGLGLAQLLDENAAAAASSLERAVELDADDANSAIYLSRAYLQLDRGADALDVLSAARDNTMIEGEDRDRLEQEYLNALASSGQLERAIAEFEQQVENFPDNALIRYNYGTLLLNTDRYAEAIEQFEAATELNADDSNAFYNLGVASLREAGRLQTEAGSLEFNEQNQARYDALIAEGDSRLESALDALETARDLTTDENRPTVCSTLLTIYNQLGEEYAEQAEDAAECAGVDAN